MDIPNSGAIFTLGKSYLAENTQSYFYIKNDPIKRLIAGPHQSAVICESGRLFVWGENAHCQLGIGNPSNINNNNSDIITKPTCVKALKSLGLKIADVAFGSNWSILLTHSNELFFSGCNIFPSDSKVTRSNFTTTTVADEQCEIARKHFRIDDLENCLTKSEDGEYYISVLAGNEHFVLMTNYGRLIAWGSNQNYQLGLSNDDTVQEPHEIQLDAPVQQFACGPESTLVLTTSSKLYLTGILNEFVFSEFTELQQNLAPNEQIIFMHISKTNEIYIVTTSGSIYRSIESLRTKTLIFQRFYDYDSEENGPIWKLVKGFSFYTVLTRANKFYTTFSESGHHLKTFREISKFKNLRLLDVAVGNQHVLVHGIPRSSTMSATVGPGVEPHRFASRTFVMAANVMNGTAERSHSRGHSGTKGSKENGGTVEKETMKSTGINNNNMPANGAKEQTPTASAQKSDKNKIKNAKNKKEEKDIAEKAKKPTQEDKPLDKARASEENKAATNKGNGKDVAKIVTAAAIIGVNSENETHETNSPTESEKSRASMNLSQTTVKYMGSPTTDKHLRPRTPYPDSGTTASTPTAMKTTPLRNYSYEAAMMDHDHLDRTSPELVDSLEHIPENNGLERDNNKAFANALAPFEEDEHLAVEINTSTDPLNSTLVVNEIRFINNGVDVTDNVKAASFDTEDTESIADSSEEQLEDTKRGSHDAKKLDSKVKNFIEKKVKNVSEEVSGIKDELSADVKHISEGVEEASKAMAEKAENAATSAVKSVNEQATKLQHNLKSHAEEANQALSREIENAASSVTNFSNSVETELKDGWSKEAKHVKDGVSNVQTDLKSQAQKASDTVKTNIENANEVSRSVEAEVSNALSTKADEIREGVSKFNDNLSATAEDVEKSISEGVSNVQTDLKSQATEASDTLTGKLENTAKKAAAAATEVRESVATAAKKAAAGARDAVETVEEGAKQVANETKNTVESIGSSAIKVAKNAVGNAFIKMSDGTKDAVDTVAAKIANEVHDAKENISAMLHGGKSPKTTSPREQEETQSTASGAETSKVVGAKTNTIFVEDDERTTASVNSTQNSTGNPFDSKSQNAYEFDDGFNDIVERGKKALRDEINNMHQTQHQQQEIIHHTAEKEKGKVRQFFSDLRVMSCGNEKSVAVEGNHKPPRYSAHTHRGNQQNNTSQVCSIL